ncbi:MAG: tetratricopeptide repeat protein [Acidobacteriota bacterium]
MRSAFLLFGVWFAASVPEEGWKRGQALLAAGRPEEGALLLESFASAPPQNAAALASLAAAYAAVEDERAEATYRRAIALAPRNYPLRLELVQALWRSERDTAGNEEMEKLIREAGTPRLRGFYGAQLMRQHRFADAGRELQAACRGAVCGAEALESWASALLETGRFEEAAARWREATAAGPGRLPARLGLARVLLLQGDPVSARRELERARGDFPRSPEVRLELGRALEALGETDAAESAYRKAIDLAPDLPRGRYALGTLLARKGREEEARREIALYQEAFDSEQRERFQAGARRAELNLGWTELAGGNAEKALKQFERRPEDPEALRGQAAALSGLGRHAEAVGVLERALAAAPSDSRIRYALERERRRAALR